MAFFKNILSKEKKETKKKEKEQEEQILNKRRYLRYPIENIFVENLGTINDISKKGISVQVSNTDNLKAELLNLNVGNDRCTAIVKRKTKDTIGLEFQGLFENKGFIKKNIKTIQKIKIEPKKAISEEEFFKCQFSDTLRIIINLMAELEDENTTVERLKRNISEVPELKNLIIKKANSVEESSSVEIKDIETAIVRLGISKIKRISKDYVTKRSLSLTPIFHNFEYYEAYNILKTVSFKKFAPLFNFNDKRAEGRSLLAIENTGLNLLKQILGIKFMENYRLPKSLYMNTSRLFEQICIGVDNLQVNEKIFVQNQGNFKYIFDGYVLGNKMLDPTYKIPPDLKLSIGNRRLRYGFIVFLSYLATIFIMEKDRYTGYVLINRLKRLGLDKNKALSVLNEIVYEGNKILENIGLRKVLKPVSNPSISLNLEKIFPKNIYFANLINKFKTVKEHNIKRISIRYDDETFSQYLLQKILEIPEFGMEYKSFCYLPVENINFEDLLPEDLSGFDVVIFENIDKINPNSFKNLKFIWKEFEGTIITTFSYNSLLDFDNPQLYELIKENIIEIPSIFKSENYEYMLQIAGKKLKEFSESINLDKDKYKNKTLDMESILKENIKNYCEDLSKEEH